VIVDRLEAWQENQGWNLKGRGSTAAGVSELHSFESRACGHGFARKSERLWRVELSEIVQKPITEIFGSGKVFGSFGISPNSGNGMKQYAKQNGKASWMSL